MIETEKILKKHNLRLTDGRRSILDIFLNNPVALSHASIEEKLPNFDRVTIYRTLYSFVENGILHKVLDDGMASKFALCHTCHDHKHTHQHVHFKCEICLDTTCLEKTRIPSFVMPDGFLAHEIGLLVQGICPKCSQKN